MDPTGSVNIAAAPLSRPQSGSRNTQALESPATSTASSGNDNRSKDTVTLSLDARIMLENGTFPEQGPGSGAGSGVSASLTLTASQDPEQNPLLKSRLLSKEVNALMEREAEYNRARDSSVRSALGIPDGMGYAAQGAAGKALDVIAERHGIDKPQPSQFMIEAGWTDPFAGNAGAATGILEVSVPNTGQKAVIAFDRNVAASLKTSSVVPLDSDRNDTQGLMGKIADGPLKSVTDLRGEAGTRLYAVTDGKNTRDAQVAATIHSTGMDDFATSSAADVLKKLMRYLQ